MTLLILTNKILLKESVQNLQIIRMIQAFLSTETLKLTQEETCRTFLPLSQNSISTTAMQMGTVIIVTQLMIMISKINKKYPTLGLLRKWTNEEITATTTKPRITMMIIHMMIIMWRVMSMGFMGKGTRRFQYLMKT